MMFGCASKWCMFTIYSHCKMQMMIHWFSYVQTHWTSPDQVLCIVHPCSTRISIERSIFGTQPHDMMHRFFVFELSSKRGHWMFNIARCKMASSTLHQTQESKTLSNSTGGSATNYIKESLERFFQRQGEWSQKISLYIYLSRSSVCQKVIPPVNFTQLWKTTSFTIGT